MTASAQPVSDDQLSALSLEELLSLRVSVASKTAESTRESPGIISIITREEILNTGATDLVDILQQVPGFAFGVDVSNVVSPGIRGNWAATGKVLVLLDGLQLNEEMFGSFPLGNHIPLEHIERIEIIRGPGSAIYGGEAELAVVNIIMRGTAEFEGVSGSLVGAGASTLAHGSANASVTRLFDPQSNLSLSVSGSFAIGARSDRDYRDLLGNSYDLEDQSDLDNRFLHIDVRYRQLQLRLLYDDYGVSTRDGYDMIFPRAVEMRFRSYFADLQYDHDITDNIRITPRLSYKRQLPWRTLDRDYLYDKTADNLTAALNVSYDPHPSVNFLVGNEFSIVHAFLNTEEMVGFQKPFGDANQVTYTSFAAYAQALVRHRFANLTLGARYELHSDFDSSFVPRLALTKMIDRFHFKLLLARAFRAPSIENINAGPVDPERTTAFESEVGWQITDTAIISANYFEVRISDPIIYRYDEVNMSDDYINVPATGTRGVEADLRIRDSLGYLYLNYSYYRLVSRIRGSSVAPEGLQDCDTGRFRRLCSCDGRSHV
jgi:outer membrane cobalamin receptor